MTSPSRIRYLLWRGMRLPQSIVVSLSTHERLMLRPYPSDDLATAYEVFMAHAYDCPRPLDPSAVRRIVDLGANVGYTSLYWMRRYQNAHVTAFEPHPVHLDLLRRHLELNGDSERVTLRPYAAGTRNGTAYLKDDSVRSTVVARKGPKTIPIGVVDFFQQIGSDPVDLLKIDIEGGEYAILADARFASVRPRALVMEWHRTPEYPDGKGWCTRRLTELGYVTINGTCYGNEHGLIWAFYS